MFRTPQLLGLRQNVVSQLSKKLGFPASNATAPVLSTPTMQLLTLKGSMEDVSEMSRRVHVAKVFSLFVCQPKFKAYIGQLSPTSRERGLWHSIFLNTANELCNEAVGRDKHQSVSDKNESTADCSQKNEALEDMISLIAESARLNFPLPISNYSTITSLIAANERYTDELISVLSCAEETGVEISEKMISEAVVELAAQGKFSLILEILSKKKAEISPLLAFEMVEVMSEDASGVHQDAEGEEDESGFLELQKILEGRFSNVKDPFWDSLDNDGLFAVGIDAAGDVDEDSIGEVIDIEIVDADDDDDNDDGDDNFDGDGNY
mgnify:FL=1